MSLSNCTTDHRKLNFYQQPQFNEGEARLIRNYRQQNLLELPVLD